MTATLHDPEGRYLPTLGQRAGKLRLYDGVWIAVTPATDGRVCARLEDLGVELVPGGSEIGIARRTALSAAFAAGHDAFLAIDFDRWLHWAGTFPEELAAVPQRLSRQRPRRWYACLGRTARAYATHPQVQQMAERVTNQALSLALGRRLDATAGASWLARDGAALVLRESVEPTNATDLEWTALIYHHDPPRLGMVWCEGLEFETAAFYPAEIAAAGGRDQWIHQTYNHPASWQRRLQLATDSVTALARVLDEGSS